MIKLLRSVFSRGADNADPRDRLQALVNNNAQAFDRKRSAAAKKGHATRKAIAARGRYNRFINDPLVKAVLTERGRGTSSARKTKRLMLVERDGSNCHWCCRPLQIVDGSREDFGTLDHVIPHAVGGSGEVHNLVLACQTCNHARSLQQARIPLKVKNTRTALLNAVATA